MTVATFLREAAQDVVQARDWYNEARPGLGDDFVAEVEGLVDRILSFPSGLPVLHGEFRKAAMTRFPYLLAFREHDHRVVVAAVWHGRRQPDDLLRRLRK